ncbi:MAG: hypothetical protein KDC57_03115 [Saprospiraceae bacterium]|nr:hypothetical protein [Saprospiraceae bacterium]
MSIHTKWDDSYSEWVIYTADESIEGTLSIRWPLQGDWSKWDYRIGEEAGSFEMRYLEDPGYWEARSGNTLLTARWFWPGDVSHWKVMDDDLTWQWQTRWRHVTEEWLLTEPKEHGSLQLYTEYEGDPRDWIIEDRMNPEVPLVTKLFMVFLGIYHASPKH